jgi:hypothetical protein
VRLRKSEERAAGTEHALAQAVRKHQDAERALDTHRGQLREASAALARALAAGCSPGVAPRTSPQRPGIGRVQDMTPEERDYAALLAISMGAAASGGGGREDPRRSRVTTRGELARQDPNGFRYMRTGTGVAVIPPDWRGTGRR